MLLLLTPLRTEHLLQLSVAISSKRFVYTLVCMHAVVTARILPLELFLLYYYYLLPFERYIWSKDNFP